MSVIEGQEFYISKRVGKAIMDFAFRKQSWPKNLGELWDYGVVRDRNYLNRFCCPVSGSRPLSISALNASSARRL